MQNARDTGSAASACGVGSRDATPPQNAGGGRESPASLGAALTCPAWTCGRRRCRRPPACWAPAGPLGWGCAASGAARRSGFCPGSGAPAEGAEEGQLLGEPGGGVGSSCPPHSRPHTHLEGRTQTELLGVIQQHLPGGTQLQAVDAPPLAQQLLLRREPASLVTRSSRGRGAWPAWLGRGRHSPGVALSTATRWGGCQGSLQPERQSTSDRHEGRWSLTGFPAWPLQAGGQRRWAQPGPDPAGPSTAPPHLLHQEASILQVLDKLPPPAFLAPGGLLPAAPRPSGPVPLVVRLPALPPALPRGPDLLLPDQDKVCKRAEGGLERGRDRPPHNSEQVQSPTRA